LYFLVFLKESSNIGFDISKINEILKNPHPVSFLEVIFIFLSLKNLGPSTLERDFFHFVPKSPSK